MAEPLVTLALETVRNLLINENVIFSGVYSKVEELHQELQRIQNLLKDDAFARHQHVDEPIRSWLKNVKDLSYRAEDVLDEYAILVMFKRRSGVKKLLCSKFSCLIFHNNVAVKIKAIQRDLNSLIENIQTYSIFDFFIIFEREKEEQRRLLRLTSPHENNDDFVGTGRDMEKLVSFVIDGSKYEVISIYGMGGSGKTSTARKVFNHPDIKQVFDAFAWVCVTQTYDPIKILQDLLDQLLSKGDHAARIEGNIINDISNVLLNKKCLIVFDDVWDVCSDLEELVHAVRNAKGHSKLLLTTGIYIVADLGYVYHQRLLSDEDGLKLLLKEAFPQNKPKDFEQEPLYNDLGIEMVRKCGGNRLAISALGGILRKKLSIKEWKMINKDIGSALNSETDNITTKRLALSYQDLNYLLKPCFLYMGIFGKDQDIDSRKLCHMWIAEGLIQIPRKDNLTGETSLMDVAEMSLEELDSRCMVQMQMDPILGRVSSCRLYEQLRGYCLRMCKVEMFLDNIEMDLRGGQSVPIDTSVGVNARRLSIHLIVDARDTRLVNPFDQITSRRLRALSLRCVKPGWHPSVDSEFPLLLDMGSHTVEVSRVKEFKLLRVLNFKDCRFYRRKLPSGIGELFYLSYLSVQGCDVDELPSFVGELPRLQTLDLRTSSTIKISPTMFAKEKILVHLYLSYFTCGSGQKLQLDGLSQLETLFSDVAMDELTLTGLSKLENIRHFKVILLWDRNDWSFMIDQMEKWKKIKRLEVGIFSAGEEIMRKAIVSHKVTDLRLSCMVSALMPPASDSAQFPQNLVSLDIVSCKYVDERMMGWISKIPSLRKLRCSANKQCVKEMKFDWMVFSELRWLELCLLADLEKLFIVEGSLPKLITLRVASCNNLKMKPDDGLRYLLNLKQVQISKMPEFKDNCLKHHSLYDHVSIEEFQIKPKDTEFNQSRSCCN